MASNLDDLMKLAQAQNSKTGMPTITPQSPMQGLLQNLASIAMNTGNPNTDRGQIFQGAGQTYLTGANNQNKQQFFQTVGQISQAKIDPAQKIDMLIALKAQHGQDYGLGLDEIVKQFGEVNKAQGDNQMVPRIDVNGNIIGTYPKGSTFAPDPNANEVKLQEKQDQLDQKRWDTLVKQTNPATASGRSTLGMASQANLRADRAIATLSNPMITNQEAGNIMADIASIYQGGAPTQFGMSEQAYSTLKGKLASSLQFFSGKPTDAVPPSVKQRLGMILDELKQTNYVAIKNNLNYIEKAQGKLLKKFPDEWSQIKGELLSGMDQPEGGAAITATNPRTGQRIKSLDGGQTWQPA